MFSTYMCSAHMCSGVARGFYGQNSPEIFDFLAHKLNFLKKNIPTLNFGPTGPLDNAIIAFGQNNELNIELDGPKNLDNFGNLFLCFPHNFHFAQYFLQIS